jgi:regulator of replication initiation timing
MTSPSDLIERLRTERSVYDAELADEAADEIERLTDDVAAMGNECIELRLEIERLRDALEQIAVHAPDIPLIELNRNMRQIAREALK